MSDENLQPLRENEQPATQAVDAVAQERAIIEAQENAQEQNDIAVANHQLQSARAHVDSLLAQIEAKGGSSAELEAARTAVYSQSVNSRADVAPALAAAQKATQSANAAEGGMIQQAGMGAALGLAGLAAIFSDKDKEAFQQFGASLGLGGDGHQVEGKTREELLAANLQSAGQALDGKAYFVETASGVTKDDKTHSKTQTIGIV